MTTPSKAEKPDDVRIVNAALTNIYNGEPLLGTPVWTPIRVGGAPPIPVPLTTAGAIMVLLASIPPEELQGNLLDSGPARRIIRAARRAISEELPHITIDVTDNLWLREKAKKWAVRAFHFNESTVVEALNDEVKFTPHKDGQISSEQILAGAKE